MKGELALLLKALAFAAHKHRDQRRKDAEASPYINHPIALADVLVNEGGITDFEVLCAALLILDGFLQHERRARAPS
jgi:guanosine-3',5'-bis(diphosphate) 3'-pyrophosphohydrolase